MYRKKIEPFGPFKKITFFNDQNGNRFSCVPQYGACLLELVFGGVSILDGYDTPEALVENQWSKSAFLLPFPNRLRDGKYSFEGNAYQFQINNTSTGNAIHGYGKSKSMAVIGSTCTKKKAGITCSYVDPGDHPAYPFPFTFSVDMCMSDDGFEVDLYFRNDGNRNLPVGLGWHPYFVLADNADTVSLQMPACQKVLIDDRMIPIGKLELVRDFTTLKTLRDTTLDNCFAVPDGLNPLEIILRSDRGQLTYWQETGPSGYRYVQLFTPPHRRSIAIEPMTCNVDAFNNGDGLLVLGPQATFDGKFGMRWEKV